MKTVKRLLFPILLLLAAHGLAWADGAIVTRGDFSEYLAGVTRYDEISGQATMIRLPTDRTTVQIQVSGLAPHQTYPTHVHNASCADGGGGHYMHDPAGPVEPPNEIWINFTTNNDGHGQNRSEGSFWARPEAQSIVIHDYSDSARVACVDLTPVQ